MVVTAGGRSTRGSMTVSGKWIASSRPRRSSRRIGPGRKEARAIDAARPAVVVEARYDRTCAVSRPDPRSPASGVVKTAYSSSPKFASARRSSRQ